MATNATAAIEKIVDREVNQLIQEHIAWDAQLHPEGAPPIPVGGDSNASSLRKFADAQIKRASLKPKGDPARSDFIAAAIRTRAGAWRKDWETDRPRREAAQREKDKAMTERRRYEAAPSPDGSKIKSLQKTIKDAAVAEQSLAQLYRALKMHEAADEAREELQEMCVAADSAARALGKKAPVIDVPRSEHTKDAEELASIFWRALHSQPL